MSFEAYPASVIPGPVYDGNSLTQVDPVSRTSFESGGVKTRRRFGNTPTAWRVKFKFVTQPEFQIFEAWYRFKISDGADKFTMLIATSTGPQVFHVCQFESMYKHSKTDYGWEVAAEIQIYNRVTQTETWLDGQLS